MPGRRWRLLSVERGKPVELANRGTFDELVVDGWLHVEMMDSRQYWMNICGLDVNVSLRADGLMDITITDDENARLILDSRGRADHGCRWTGERTGNRPHGIGW